MKINHLIKQAKLKLKILTLKNQKIDLFYLAKIKQTHHIVVLNVVILIKELPSMLMLKMMIYIQEISIILAMMIILKY